MIPMNEIVEHCDKCGTEVSVKNDAVTMHSIAWDEPYSGLLSYRRCINCSPSRAQHIVHESFEPSWMTDQSTINVSLEIKKRIKRK